MTKNDLYLGREQTLVKHFILQQYLERFAIIVGTHRNTLTYVDCFSGPWNVRSDDFQDSSFAIALKQLRKAREIHQRQTGRRLKLRAFFLEKNRSAFNKLSLFTKDITDVEIEILNEKLEVSIPAILDFIKKGGKNSFPFIFVDPTGWSGFAMDIIAPLLQVKPGEVLINFMTEHISRFIESPQDETQASFKRLFGSGEFKKRLQGLDKRDREDAIVQEYGNSVRRTGGFKYVTCAIVLHAVENRTHFNLIYATRNPKGVQVFKDTEKKAMSIMQEARGDAHQRKREEKTGQTELFGGSALYRGGPKNLNNKISGYALLTVA
ncbi:MAG: hypothetical protein NPIRA02_30680 [Nitrospirales bacterium]|nr:MAG: hypothetical protein NPIRA02_30680 [Nitrospirales bacterium]